MPRRCARERLRLAARAAAAVAAVAIACAGIRVATWVAPGTDFSRYRSFAVVADDGGIPRVEAAVGDAIASVLRERGFVPEPFTGADLVVRFRGSTEPGSRRVLAGDGSARATKIERYVEGTLVIEIYEGDGGPRIYRAEGVANLRDAKSLATDASREARAVLAKFPPPPTPVVDATAPPGTVDPT